ncbi:hypothetical protein [Phocaeicola sp.]
MQKNERLFFINKHPFLENERPNPENKCPFLSDSPISVSKYGRTKCLYLANDEAERLLMM